MDILIIARNEMSVNFLEHRGFKKKRERVIINTLRQHRAEIILTVLFILLLFVSYIYFRHYSKLIRDPREIKTVVKSYGRYSVLVFIVLQFLQVVLFFIPGEIVQIAGGYIYGTLWGGLLSLLGITLGSLFAFIIAKKLGRPFVERIVSEKDLKLFGRILDAGGDRGRSRAIKIVFILYLIPGLPKDVLAYICGITSMDHKSFIVYSTAGRTPAVIISAYFGATLYSGSRVVPAVIAIVMSILFLIGVFKGERLLRSMGREGGSSSNK
jgi:uncharacterized membrane protein YdjX (TVP38/TMEM64 family)